MIHYYTTDNNCKSPLTNEAGAIFPLTAGSFDDLSRIANRNIDALVKENSSLLVFPNTLGAHHDDVKALSVFNLQCTAGSPETATLETGNLMGFIGVGNTQLSITSRFAQCRAAHPDYFLHYMLARVFSVNIFRLNHDSAPSRQLDFLLFVLPFLLKKALAQGVFRKYETFHRNDAQTKGTCDIPRHLALNMPFNGKVAYSSRERTVDNPLMQLIRHTVEFMKTQPLGSCILNAACMAEPLRIVYEATPHYVTHARNRVIMQNSKLFVHPYYTAYGPLQTFCLMVLRHCKLKYAAEHKPVFGVLFDGAWLWEEYLASFLTPPPLELMHPQNKIHKGGIQIYPKRYCYPDFYKKSGKNEKSAFVLDAKYKRLAQENKAGESLARFDCDDLYQLIAYLHLLPARCGALIYPFSCEGEAEKGQISKSKNICGDGGLLFAIGVPVPREAGNDFDFAERMGRIEAAIVRQLGNVLDELARA